MRYTINGRLCGHICPDQHEPIYPGAVQLYRLLDSDDTNEDDPVNEDRTRVVETFKLMSDDDVQSIESRYIGDMDLERDGSFSFQDIDEKQDSYFGGPFVIHARVEGVQGRPDSDTTPVQARLATVYPVWDRTQEGKIVNLDPFCVSKAFWCSIRKLFDAWVICGTVTDCETGEGFSGLTVHAFDTDIIQTDEIGQATTGSGGQFRIDYSSADFENTTFPAIDIELIGGPDLFFTIETSGGTELYREDTSEGRTEDRENVGPCFHVDLCIEDTVGTDEALFTGIGKVYLTDIENDDANSMGRQIQESQGVGGPGYGFRGNLDLVGQVPSRIGGKPYHYRFGYVVDGASTPTWLSGDSDKIATATVGFKRRPTGAGTEELVPIIVAPDDYNPTRFPTGHEVVFPDSDGWIAVDLETINGGFGGGNSPLLSLKTGSIPALKGGPPGSDRPAGEPAAPQQNGKLVEVIFQAEPVDGSEPKRFEVRQHVYVNNWSPLILLDRVAEDPCDAENEADASIELRYTVDHEFMGRWQLIVDSEADDFPLTRDSGEGPRGTANTDTITIDASEDASPRWVSCAYRVVLSGTANVTDGRSNLTRPSRRQQSLFYIS